MTRREILTAAAVAAPFAAVGVVGGIAADLNEAKRRVSPAPKTGPSMEQLINLAEHGPDRQYYGRLLGEALAVTGRIANDNGDGSVSLYTAELIQNTRGGPKHWAWRKETVSGSGRPMPAAVLPHIRAANRGEDFPAGVPFERLN
jgi:hypothetical protein